MTGDEAESLRSQRDALLAALEPLLIEIEPLRYRERLAIEQAVEDKRKWAAEANAQAPHGTEPWCFITEFRRSLEDQIEPLTRAVREANRVFDEIAGSITKVEGSR